MGKKRIAKYIELLDFGMEIVVSGIHLSGIEDELDDLLITEVNAFVTATASCLKGAYRKLS